MNDKQEGFDQEENESYALVSSHIDLKLHQQTKIKTKSKMVFRSPSTVFYHIHMTLSPEDHLDFNNQILSEQNDVESSDLQQKGQSLYLLPLDTITIKQQKYAQQSTGEENKILMQKVSDIFPKKYPCIFNKFQENILLKSDLTIFIKNIAKTIKFQLTKSIQSPFTGQIIEKEKNPTKQIQKRKDLSISRLKIRKSNRYQSQKILTLSQSKVLSKKIDLSPFQLQRSMILQRQISKKSTQIEFYSNFQSGNLHVVFKDKLNENLMYLFLTNDINTHGYNQWFYFGTKYTGKENAKKIRFLIMNISKQFKFQQGMKLLTLEDGKWKRKTPFNVYKNKYSRYNNSGNLMTIDFEYEFSSQKNKMVFFSFIYPYTYSRLLSFMKEIKSRSYKNLFVSVQSMGRSELMNHIPVVKIQKLEAKNLRTESIKKSCIIVLARQHASETPSSFICQSLIRQLLNESDEWNELMNNFTFIIIPMLNPDGVIHGNSRTNIKGYDINRLWQINRNSFFTSIQTQQTISYILSLQKSYNIQYTIDLHSHSKQYGSFLYSCDNGEVSKLFTYYFTQQGPECVYSRCKVNLTPDKKCTFRGLMYYRFGIKNSFTLQTSFYGFKQDKNNPNSKIIPFKLKNFQSIADSLLFAISETQKTRTKSEAKKVLFQKIEMLDAKFKVFRKNHSLRNKQNESSSDSDPEGQYLNIKERQQNGQNIKIVLLNNKQPVQQRYKRSEEQIYRSTQRSKDFSVHNKSLQMISKVSCLFVTQQDSKKRRKRIYTTKAKDQANETKEEISNQLSDGFMSKKYPSQVKKQLGFRQTLRRGYRMSHSETSYSQLFLDSKKPQQKQQQRNYIVYPTSTDLEINHQKVRKLHDQIFEGKIKVKSIKQQDRLLKRMGKASIIGRQQLLRTKDLFTNKFLKQYSQRSQLGHLLNIEKIDKFRKEKINYQDL